MYQPRFLLSKLNCTYNVRCMKRRYIQVCVVHSPSCPALTVSFGFGNEWNCAPSGGWRLTLAGQVCRVSIVGVEYSEGSKLFHLGSK